MPRAPHNPGAWPALMRAETAAAYVDEVSVERFRARAGPGLAYPSPIRIAGRGEVWSRAALDSAVARIEGTGDTVIHDIAEHLQ